MTSIGDLIITRDFQGVNLLLSNNINCAGVSCSGISLNSQIFSSSNPIIDTTSTQTITGDKTFSGNVAYGSCVDAGSCGR